MIVQLEQGIHLPQHSLWLDSLRSRPIGIISHAHADHAGWHRCTIATPATAALMRARTPPPQKTEIIELDFHTPHALADSRVTLIPAGHVLGSSQVFIESEHGSLLYTGDFKLKPSLTSEPATAKQADTLIIECTFGLPKYQFPDTEQVRQDIRTFCQQAIDEGFIPVLYAYSLGKSQELLAILKPCNIPVVVASSIDRISQVYQQYGVPLAEYDEFRGSNLRGKILITPPHQRRALLAALPKIRTAIVSGWALDSSARYRYQCDAAFPLSDHADYPDLLQYVREVNPNRVYTVHGYTEQFARDLRALGFDALALGGLNQLEFRMEELATSEFLGRSESLDDT